MKVKGKVGDQEVMVLIDIGATHNFISAELVEKLQLPVTGAEAYGITMGTGALVAGRGIC